MSFQEADARLKLESHRATYEFDLTHLHKTSKLADVYGEMTFEWVDDCDGWSNIQNYSMTYFYTEGKSASIESDMMTWEAKDQSLYRFLVNRKMNGKLSEVIKGSAHTDSKGYTHFKYETPESIVFEKATDVLFPSKHSFELIERTREGNKAFMSSFFDGGDTDGPIKLNSIFLGRKKAPTFDRAEVDGSLIKEEGFRFRFSFFPFLDQKEMMQPNYEMDILIHENGIISDMAMDYDEFSLKATLTSLELLDKTQCQ